MKRLHLQYSLHYERVFSRRDFDYDPADPPWSEISWMLFFAADRELLGWGAGRRNREGVVAVKCFGEPVADVWLPAERAKRMSMRDFDRCLRRLLHLYERQRPLPERRCGGRRLTPLPGRRGPMRGAAR